MCVCVCIYIYIYIFVCGLMSSVCQWSGRSGFNPRSSHIKDSKKIVLDATLLNTQHYKVRIKGKVHIVYIHPLNGYWELNSYEEPCIYANGNAITSFARELNPTGVGEHIHIVYNTYYTYCILYILYMLYIYIYIYINGREIYIWCGWWFVNYLLIIHADTCFDFKFTHMQKTFSYKLF